MGIVASTLAGNYSVGWTIAAGLVGGVAFLMVVYMGPGVHMTRMNFLYLLGTMMAPRASEATAYAVGFMVHVMLSAGFGLAHAGLLHALDVTSGGQAAGWDLLIETLHGIVILMALPMMLLSMHLLVREGRIPA